MRPRSFFSFFWAHEVIHGEQYPWFFFGKSVCKNYSYVASDSQICPCKQTTMYQNLVSIGPMLPASGQYRPRSGTLWPVCRVGASQNEDEVTISRSHTARPSAVTGLILQWVSGPWETWWTPLTARYFSLWETRKWRSNRWASARKM